MISLLIEKIINLLGFDLEFNFDEIVEHVLIDLIVLICSFSAIFIITLIGGFVMKLGGM